MSSKRPIPPHLAPFFVSRGGVTVTTIPARFRGCLEGAIDKERRRTTPHPGFQRPGELEERCAELEALLVEMGVAVPPRRRS